MITVLALFAQLSSESLRMIEKLIAAGQHREALVAMAALPVSAQRHLLASRAYDGLRDAPNAVREAEAALALEPQSEAAHLQLGQIFLGHNTPKAALEVFTEALTYHPRSYLLKAGRGLALKDLMIYDDAEKELRGCLEQRPAFSVCFDGLATVYLQAKRFDDLQRVAAGYQRQAPNDYRGHYFLAAAQSGAGGEPAAIVALLTASIRLQPKFAAAHALLGRTRLGQDDIPGAIRALEKAVGLRPGYAPALLNLAQAYKRAGRTADAERAFEQLRQANELERQGKPTLLYHRGK